MNGIYISWQQILVVALLVVGVYVAELLLFIRKTKAGAPKLVTPSPDDLARLQQDLAALRAELIQLATRVEVMAKTPVKTTTGDNESPYSQAIKLAQQGLDSNAVASGCGISRGEAELIVAIYRAANRP